MPPPPQIVVSTHFDDAALSLARVLQGAGPLATVVTVCGGPPPPGAAVGEWDARAGFATGAQAAHTRAGEDRAACAVTGARSHPLPHPDSPYGALPDGAILRAEIEPLLGAVGVLWLPAGIGNEDHAWVRDALLPLARRLSADRARIYADLPYAGNEVEPGHLEAWRLPDASFERKLEAVRCHASQLPLLEAEWPGLLARDGPLACERCLADPPAGVILRS